MASDKIKLLISSCLIGENVKYDGMNNFVGSQTIEKLQNQYELYHFCPEVEGGLSIPRLKCEIVSYHPLKIIDENRKNRTIEFLHGAKKTLRLCKENNIQIAILKSTSPSCSSKYVNDGTFTKNKISGLGITTLLLMKNGIVVVDETEIEKLLNYE
jgi:uncharacterized protein YbbK (DUF523 family)